MLVALLGMCKLHPPLDLSINQVACCAHFPASSSGIRSLLTCPVVSLVKAINLYPYSLLVWGSAPNHVPSQYPQKMISTPSLVIKYKRGRNHAPTNLRQTMQCRKEGRFSLPWLFLRYTGPKFSSLATTKGLHQKPLSPDLIHLSSTRSAALLSVSLPLISSGLHITLISISSANIAPPRWNVRLIPGTWHLAPMHRCPSMKPALLHNLLYSRKNMKL